MTVAAKLRDFALRLDPERASELVLIVAELEDPRAARLARRDDALRQLDRELHHPDTPMIARTRGLRKTIEAYRIRWVRTDQNRLDVPPGYGKLDQLLFAAFREGLGRVPTSDKHLKRILQRDN